MSVGGNVFAVSVALVPGRSGTAAGQVPRSPVIPDGCAAGDLLPRQVSVRVFFEIDLPPVRQRSDQTVRIPVESARAKPQAQRFQLAACSRILVLKFDYIGDWILCVPFSRTCGSAPLVRRSLR